MQNEAGAQSLRQSLMPAPAPWRTSTNTAALRAAHRTAPRAAWHALQGGIQTFHVERQCAVAAAQQLSSCTMRWWSAGECTDGDKMRACARSVWAALGTHLEYTYSKRHCGNRAQPPSWRRPGLSGIRGAQAHSSEQALVHALRVDVQSKRERQSAQLASCNTLASASPGLFLSAQAKYSGSARF